VGPGGLETIQGGGETVAKGCPSVWVVMLCCVWRVLGRRRGGLTVDHRRDSVLLDAAVAIRGGDVQRAEELLGSLGKMLRRNPVYLNLCGVLCEMRGKVKRAKRFYGMAFGADPKYQPAERNIRRLYELSVFGRLW
jgi:hypothetical protein